MLGREGGGHLVGWEHRLWEEQSLPQEVAATSLVLKHNQNGPYVPPELCSPNIGQLMLNKIAPTQFFVGTEWRSIQMDSDRELNG